MAINSKDIMLGKPAPDFKLINVDGSYKTLNEVMGKNGLVVAFICNHCPYVLAIQERLNELAHDLQKLEVGVLAINSNDPINYPEDSFENMKIIAKNKKYLFPYLFDETQIIAKNYDVACTPEFYGINNQGIILYHGRLDDSGREPKVNTRRDLYLAMEEIVNTGVAPSVQNPSIGCSVKWKS